MKFLSESMTSASGSIGGVTYSHNRSGMYRRARRVPVNPNTTYQQSQRDAFSTAAGLWRTLTAPQRADWEAYAAATPTTNSLGQTVYLTGAQQHQAYNALSYRFGLGALAAPPATPGRAPLGMPVVAIDQSAVSVAITDIDTGMNTGVLGIFLGDPVSAGVSFFAGPYQLRTTGNVAAGAVAAITPVAGRNGSTMVAGTRIPYRLIGFDANSKISQVASGIVTVVA
jgi:hypothetical protein